MTIRVTITKPGVTDGYGLPMVVGATYTVDDAFGLSLISQGRASDTDNVQTSPGLNLGAPISVVYVNAAAIAAPTAQMIASYNVQFALDTAPFMRYQSNGTTLVPLPLYSVDSSGTVTGFTGPSGTQSLLLSATGLAAPLIVGHDNQTYTRNSVNAAGDSTFQTLTSFVLPAGCMGPNGTLIFEMETQSVGAVATSAFQLYIGATAITVEVSWTATTYDNRMMYWFNTAAAVNKYRGTTLRQANSTTGFTATAVDTSVSNTVDIKCRWGSAANAHTLSLHSYRAIVEFGA